MVEVVRSQCRVLLHLHESLQDLFGGRKGHVQFFQHKDQKEIFVIQIRKGHLVDVGRFLMGLSFHIKEQYHIFQGVAMREQLSMPNGGYPASQDYEYAFKHVFLRFKLRPELQSLLFSSKCLKEGEVYQDIARMPYIIADVLERLEQPEQQAAAG
jgi:hypothetical protein